MIAHPYRPLIAMQDRGFAILHSFFIFLWFKAIFFPKTASLKDKTPRENPLQSATAYDIVSMIL